VRTLAVRVVALGWSVLLGGCELVVGGDGHAAIEGVGASVEAGPSVDDASLTEASTPSVDTGKAAEASCAAPQHCLDQASSCVNGCTQKYDACMNDQGGGGPSRHPDCGAQLAMCEAPCQANCVACVACPAVEAACASH
jgi:hypothetical protein